jgi:hypothetical protein
MAEIKNYQGIKRSGEQLFYLPGTIHAKPALRHQQDPTNWYGSLALLAEAKVLSTHIFKHYLKVFKFGLCLAQCGFGDTFIVDRIHS